jgi:Tfp pilus assembly protein PilP
MLAQAKKDLNKQKTAEIQKTIISIAKQACLSANVQNALLKSICIDECELVDWIDRLNATCTHQIDALRSILSYVKEEYKNSQFGG